MTKQFILTTSFAIALMVSFQSCDKDDETPDEENTSGSSWTITVDAYTLDNGVYTATGNELIFDSEEECQTWNRTAQEDAHDTESHEHFNAAADVSYDNSTTTFSWTEYGPELDQATIDATCSAGDNGVSKTVDNSSYYQDKPNLYLKISSVTEN